MVALGLLGAAPPGQAVAITVKDFLLDWDHGRYDDAAALTTGGESAAVAAALRAAYSQLGAADIQLTMGPIATRGTTATAQFNAAVDLGRGGSAWQYPGSFRLRKIGSAWRVVWAPSVIVPGLQVGERLAVVTTMPSRALLLDSSGNSLIPESTDYVAGVIPEKVVNPSVTATQLAQLTGLGDDALEIRGRILAAPSRAFLRLIRMEKASYQHLQSGLSRIQGVRVIPAVERIFASSVPAVTGTVGTETAPVLVTAGAPYQPGITVGTSGLQQAFQSTLAGTPTTQVVVQAADGRVLRVLNSWPGAPGQPVRTTIDPAVQDSAQRAAGGSAAPAAIVAIRSGGGQILAVAQHDVAGLPAVDPLAGQYQPGQSFTIISAATLLAGNVDLGTPTPCPATNQPGVQVFRNQPQPQPGLGSNPTFKTDFTHACATGFTSLILGPSGRRLSATAWDFGIGQPWKLPLAASSGSINPVSGSTSTDELVADAIGTGTVKVSPLAMALAAGVVESGTWHAPSLVVTPVAATAAVRKPLSDPVVATLQGLMRTAVTSGAARAAGTGGVAVAGQVGVAPLAGHPGLYTIWFVGYSHNVAFAVLVISHVASFDPAAQLAAQFAAGLPA